MPEHRDRWYNLQSKEEEKILGVWQTRVLNDLEQAIFVRGGSIITVLAHSDCMALSRCIKNDVRGGSSTRGLSLSLWAFL